MIGQNTVLILVSFESSVSASTLTTEVQHVSVCIVLQ